jgi:hypothetical protein
MTETDILQTQPINVVPMDDILQRPIPTGRRMYSDSYSNGSFLTEQPAIVSQPGPFVSNFPTQQPSYDRTTNLLPTPASFPAQQPIYDQFNQTTNRRTSLFDETNSSQNLNSQPILLFSQPGSSDEGQTTGEFTTPDQNISNEGEEQAEAQESGEAEEEYVDNNDSTLSERGQQFETNSRGVISNSGAQNRRSTQSIRPENNNDNVPENNGGFISRSNSNVSDERKPILSGTFGSRSSPASILKSSPSASLGPPSRRIVPGDSFARASTNEKPTGTRARTLVDSSRTPQVAEEIDDNGTYTTVQPILLSKQNELEFTRNIFRKTLNPEAADHRSLKDRDAELKQKHETQLALEDLNRGDEGSFGYIPNILSRRELDMVLNKLSADDLHRVGKFFLDPKSLTQRNLTNRHLIRDIQALDASLRSNNPHHIFETFLNAQVMDAVDSQHKLTHQHPIFALNPSSSPISERRVSKRQRPSFTLHRVALRPEEILTRTPILTNSTETPSREILLHELDKLNDSHLQEALVALGFLSL